MASAFVAHDVVDAVQARVLKDPFCDLVPTQDCCELLGLLAIVEEGKVAVAALVEASAVYALRHVLQTVVGRAAAIKAGVIGMLRGRLQSCAGLTDAEIVAAHVSFDSLAGAQATAHAALALAPHIMQARAQLPAHPFPKSLAKILGLPPQVHEEPTANMAKLAKQ